MDYSDARASLNSAIGSLRTTLRRVEKRLPTDQAAKFYDEANDAVALVNAHALHALIDARAASPTHHSDETTP